MRVVEEQENQVFKEIVKSIQEMDLVKINDYFSEPIDLAISFNPFYGSYRGIIIAVEKGDIVITIDSYMHVATFLNKRTQYTATLVIPKSICTKLNTIYSQVFDQLIKLQVPKKEES